MFAGDFEPGEIAGRDASQWAWLLAAGRLVDPDRHGRPLLELSGDSLGTVSAAIFLVLFNLAGLPYPGACDNFLIVFGFLFNGLIVWYARTWA